jgi:hypothetical protein
MSGHLWASRLAVAVCALLLVASMGFAAAWSAIAPWSRAPSTLAVAPRALRAPEPPAALFRDGFEADAAGSMPAGWTVADGRWDGVVLEGGSRVVRHSEGRSYGHLVAGSPGWTDYSVGVRLRPTPLSTGFAGVAARYRDRGDYYACGVYYGTAVRLWRVQGGTVALLDARRMDVSADRFHDVRLVVRGTHLSCVFDQTVVLTATDATFPSGQVALVAAADEAAEFDDVVVSG